MRKLKELLTHVLVIPLYLSPVVLYILRVFLEFRIDTPKECVLLIAKATSADRCMLLLLFIVVYLFLFVIVLTANMGSRGEQGNNSGIG